jgi:Domain of unknown function (DUF4296)
MNRITFMALAIFVLASCQSESTQEIPAGVISRDSMVKIMADVHIAEARMQISDIRNSNPALKNTYLQEVLRRSGTDTARFNFSFKYYSGNPEIFAAMYEDVIVEISKRQAKQ